MSRFRRTVAICGLALAVTTACSSSSEKEASPSTSATSAGPTTTARPVDTSFTGQGSAQFCSLAKTYTDRFANVGAATTPAQLKTVVQDGRAAINDAAAAAPAEIKPDVQVIADAFGSLVNGLDKVNYDVTKVSAEAFAPLQAPQFQASSTRFQAYTTKVCGITG